MSKIFVIPLMLISSSVFAFDINCTSGVETYWDGPESIVLSKHNRGGRWSGASYLYARFIYDKKSFQRIEVEENVDFEIIQKEPLIYQVSFLHKPLYSDAYKVHCFVSVEL